MTLELGGAEISPWWLVAVFGAIGIVVMLAVLAVVRAQRRMLAKHPHLAALLDDSKGTSLETRGRWRSYAVTLGAGDIRDDVATVNIGATRNFGERTWSMDVDEGDAVGSGDEPEGGAWDALFARAIALGVTEFDCSCDSLSLYGIRVDGGQETRIRAAMDVLVEMLQLLGASTEHGGPGGSADGGGAGTEPAPVRSPIS